jgi:starvation-inducible DNA-binding protein
MYEELHDAIDPLAEHIRAIDVYAPISIMDLFHFKMVTEDVVQPTSTQTMFANLLTANNQVIESLNKLFDACTAANNQGFANFVADRLDIHAKHGWQLKSFLKAGE